MNNTSCNIRVYSQDGLCVYHTTNQFQGNGEIKFEAVIAASAADIKGVVPFELK